MHLRRGQPFDAETLFDVWLRAVRATHSFVAEEDLQTLIPLVRSYLNSRDSEFWVLCADSEDAVGFMGLSQDTIESLFIAPEHHRRGGGRLLVEKAKGLCGELTVDVNEQNLGARRFYEALGFSVESRSETDEMGLPYPLLHMRRPADGGS